LPAANVALHQSEGAVVLDVIAHVLRLQYLLAAQPDGNVARHHAERAEIRLVLISLVVEH